MGTCWGAANTIRGSRFRTADEEQLDGLASNDDVDVGGAENGKKTCFPHLVVATNQTFW